MRLLLDTHAFLWFLLDTKIHSTDCSSPKRTSRGFTWSAPTRSLMPTESPASGRRPRG